MSSPDRLSDCPPEGEWIGPAVELVAWGRRLGRLLAGVARNEDLSETQFQLLWILGCRAQPLASQVDLARELALSPAQISGLLEELRRRGLVTGRTAPADRRRRMWRLTSAGFARRIADGSRLAREVVPVEPSLTEAAVGLLRSGEVPSPGRLRPFVAEPDGPSGSHDENRPHPPACDREGGRQP